MWTFYTVAGAIGPVLMGQSFDASGSYEVRLVRLALVTLAVAALMLPLPRYGSLQTARPLPAAALVLK